MRIGLFSDTFPPQINGVANSTYILFEELKKHGHEVYVITTAVGKDDAGWNQDHTILRFSGIKLKFLYGYTMTGPFHLLARRMIEDLHLQLIHVQTEFGIGIFARLCARELKIPLVSTYHTTYEDYTHYWNLLHLDSVDKVSKRVIAWLSRMYGDSCQRVIVPSEKTKELLQRYHVHSPMAVIPTGLMLDRFSRAHLDPARTKQIRDTYGIKETDTLLIYVGRLAEEKAMDLVVRAFPKILEKTPDVKLLVVGGGPDFEPLQKLAEKCGVSGSVKFAGPHPAEEVPDYYRAADAFISPSLSETQGMTFIEALAAGLPLFARHDEVLDDLLIPGKTGWFFSDEDDLSAAVEQMKQLSAEESDTWRRNAEKQVQPYSSEHFVRSVLDVYEDVLEGFHTEYTVVDLHVKDSIVQIYLKKTDGSQEFRLNVSIDDYYRYRLVREKILSEEDVRKLKEEEERTNAYNRCVRKIAVEDRTRKEIYDWLTRNTSCSIDTVNAIVEKLEEKGYLNDRRYCAEQVMALENTLHGREYIVKTLKKKGIPLETIEEVLAEDASDETGRAETFAARYARGHRNESVAKMRNSIRTKLMTRGFASDVISDVLERLDLSAAENREMDNLRECVLKAAQRYSRKYSGMELRSRIYRYCAARGYTGADITAAMEEWNADSED
ncbi:MAG: RecX family transcriptional regulator [Solobacterium sp.]|nr:RecX family transcriptional regulator [Solobacterium sp.]